MDGPARFPAETFLFADNEVQAELIDSGLEGLQLAALASSGPKEYEQCERE